MGPEASALIWDLVRVSDGQMPGEPRPGDRIQHDECADQINCASNTNFPEAGIPAVKDQDDTDRVG